MKVGISYINVWQVHFRAIELLEIKRFHDDMFI